jgi:hypothetical protein
MSKKRGVNGDQRLMVEKKAHIKSMAMEREGEKRSMVGRREKKKEIQQSTIRRQ